jgi:hypothetical protein
MSHTPIGYQIKDRKALIDKDKAKQVQLLYDVYLTGASLTSTAKSVGLNLTHSSVGRILQNTSYLGDDYYPQIIKKETFDAVQLEREKRAKKLGRIFPKKEKTPVCYPKTFRLEKQEKKYNDPFKQAEYVYSLVQIKE